jgi:putative acetyltransferase
MLSIHEETRDDVSAIHQLNVLAFGQPTEADIVDLLRESGALRYSLVAVDEDEIVGHLAFSPVTITEDEKTVSALGLGPMAVTPSRQRRGIGTKLFQYWWENLADEKDNLVVVVGHADYYPRFGFQRANLFGIRWEHDVPDDVFMVLELRRGALAETQGIVRYHPAFADV